MSGQQAANRIAVVWSPEARIELKEIIKDVALQILHCVDRYLSNRVGDLKKLKPPLTGFRLRCGDHRVFFDSNDENSIEITSVRNRRDAYR